MANLIVNIAINVPCHNLFSYVWPSDFSRPILGSRVEVEFGNKIRLGIIVSTEVSAQVNKLKTVLKVLDQEAVINANIIKLFIWASEYYHYPIGEIIHQAIPKKLSTLNSELPNLPCWLKLNTDIEPKLSAASKKLWQLMLNLPQGTHLNNFCHYQIQLRTVQAAIKQGWLIKAIEPDLQNQATITLNPEQQVIADKIQSKKNFNVHYIEGNTGTGKTYIYAYLMQQYIKENKQCLLLVPEISLTNNTLQKIQKFCGPKFICHHSKLSNQQKSINWQQVFSTWSEWGVGTRSALFLPWKNLGCIIIDEAHDSSFKQQSKWRYSARDCAIMLASFLDIPVILGSATPSLESIHNINTCRYQHYKITNRFSGANLPLLRLKDMRSINQPIHPELIKRIEQNIALKQQTLIFINRRGFAPVLFCKNCQWTSDCPRCDTKLVMHKKPAKIICHYCNYQQKIPTICPECKTDNLAPVGFGSQRIEEWLKEKIAANIIRIDSDSTASNGSLEAALVSVAAEQYDIIIGTQMLAKGHHWPKLTLVIMLDADQDLFSPDFRAMEKFAQLFIQVAGRAGRENLPGCVYIQTKWPNHPKYKSLLSTDYSTFANQLLAERQQARLPPFNHMAYILVSSIDQNELTKTILKIKNLIQQANVIVIGPMPAWLSQLANSHRMYLAIMATNRSIIKSTIKKVTAIKTHHRIKITIDIDPLNLP